MKIIAVDRLFEKMVKSLYFFITLLIFIPSVRAQIVVDDGQNTINLVKRLEGPGVSISNISYYYKNYISTFPGSVPNKKPLGYFEDPFGVLGMDKGLLLTTGAAVNARGPNDDPYATQINYDYFQDPDLVPYIENYDSSNKMADLCVVEFDIVTSFPFLSFNYVFGSEEYVQTLDYHDVFVFLISGPGITGKKNIALVPNTNLPVSTASIRPSAHGFPAVNSQYYINNGTGSTPFINLDMQYNGYTTVLKAITPVFPCDTYHVKLAIADVLDDTYDAGVFIEQGSFTSVPLDLKVMYEFPRYDSAMEGCNHAKVIFKRSPFSDRAQPLQYDFLIKGNAVNGIDYVPISNSIVIPANEDSVYVIIDPLTDGISDDGEMVRLVIRSQCSFFPDHDSIDIFIREHFPYPLPSENICSGQSVVLNKSFVLTDSIFWKSSPYLSCDSCLSPRAFPPSTVYFPYLAKDTQSGCLAIDSLQVTVVDIKAAFTFHNDPCYTSLDFFFTNTSQNASSYSWDFGDNSTSAEEHPVHGFPFLNTMNPFQYNVTLQASRESPSCMADTTVTISINNPLFIPNLITVDHNGLNDRMEILGIETGCWSLSVFNRWGNLIYSNDNYKNDFTGEEVQDEVCYFLLKNSHEDREFKGWVQIINK